MESLRRALRGSFGDVYAAALTELRIAGFGGQGVILSAIVAGQGRVHLSGRVCNHDAKLRARSSRRRLQRTTSCSRKIPSSIPYVDAAGHHGASCRRKRTRAFVPELKEGGTLIVEQDLVRVTDLPQTNASLQLPGHAASPKN